MVLADVIESHEQELRARSCVWPSTCGLLLPFCLSNLLVARPTSLWAPTEMPQTNFPNPILTPRSHHHPSLPRQNSSVGEPTTIPKGEVEREGIEWPADRGDLKFPHRRTDDVGGPAYTMTWGPLTRTCTSISWDEDTWGQMVGEEGRRNVWTGDLGFKVWRSTDPLDPFFYVTSGLNQFLWTRHQKHTPEWRTRFSRPSRLHSWEQNYDDLQIWAFTGVGLD